MVIDQLEDHAFASSFQHIFGGVQLPAGIGHRIAEGPVGGTRTLLRGWGNQASFGEDPGQCRDRYRGHAQLLHVIVHADRSVIPARGLQRLAHCDRLVLDGFVCCGRRFFRPSGAGFQGCCLAFGLGSFADLVESLAANFVFRAEGGDRASGSVLWPSGDG